MDVARTRGSGWQRVGAVVLAALFGWLSAAQVPAIQLQGTVRDASGTAVAHAAVQLLVVATGAEVRGSTDAAGRFVLPVVAASDVRVTATAEGMTATESVAANRLAAPVALVLRPAGAAADGMQFSDAPAFSVAGVTDWTAVGGHGSDATLRTSESLADATARLPGSSATAATPEELKLETAVQADEARGEHTQAQEQVHTALQHHATARLYRLAGEVDERGGDPLTAVRELEQAATLDPSEENEFAWGSELLVHRAIWQAEAVFERGVAKYPASVRMQTALGTALFAGARYAQAAERLCGASDLAPAEVEPYEFLGRAELASPDALPCVTPHLARYVQLRPQNGRAHYLYAMAVLKQQERAPDAAAAALAEAQLQQAVALDAQCGDGYLELGVLAAQRGDVATAIADYSKATAADPLLADAYYRLAKAYERTGQHGLAQAAFAQHDKVVREQAAATEAQRRAVKQFLFTGAGGAATP